MKYVSFRFSITFVSTGSCPHFCAAERALTTSQTVNVASSSPVFYRGNITTQRSIMREKAFVLAILVVAPVLTFSQSPEPKSHSKITGCLTTTGRPHEYRLVDENGVTNEVYSTTIHLDSYVGKSVTLIGDQSATPSTDTGTARPAPHFKVIKAQAGSGDCKK